MSTLQVAYFRGTSLGSVAGDGVRYCLSMSDEVQGLTPRRAIMTCLCCLGLMIEDQFLDFEEPIWTDVGDQLGVV